MPRYRLEVEETVRRTVLIDAVDEATAREDWAEGEELDTEDLYHEIIVCKPDKPWLLNMHSPEVRERVNRIGGDPTLAIIDRTTRWGNPFKIVDGATRDTVIEQHRVWILEQIQSPVVMALLIDELRGKDLACWCAPARCHGEILMELANLPAEAFEKAGVAHA